MNIVEGGIYRTRSGSLIGPVVWDDVIKVWRSDNIFERNTGDYWHKDGSRYGHCEDGMDFVEMVRMAQRQTIKAGLYGIVRVSYLPDAGWMFEIIDNNYNADELREAAHLFNQLAEALERES